MGLQLVGQFPIRFLVRKLFLHEFPQLDQRKKVAPLIGKSAVRVIGGLPRVQWALARVLYRQRGSDDQHFAQAMLFARSEQHAAHSRIERELRKVVTDRRQLVTGIDRV